MARVARRGAASPADGLAQANMDLLIASARPQTELATYLRLTSARTVDALIVANTLLDDPRTRFLQEREFPFVAYGRTNSLVPYAWFDFDNQAGARVATERLIGLGHKRIALIHGPSSVTFASQRRAGFCDAMRHAGLQLDPALRIEVPLNRTDGYEAMRKLLALPDPPSTVLVDARECHAVGTTNVDSAGDDGPQGIDLVNQEVEQR